MKIFVIRNEEDKTPMTLLALISAGSKDAVTSGVFNKLFTAADAFGCAGGVATPIAVPHFGQKRTPSLSCTPHFGQNAITIPP